MTDEILDRPARLSELRELEVNLWRDIRNTERLLRDRDDEKEKGLRAEFVAAVQASEARTHERLSDIDEHLSRQDEYIMRKRFAFPTWVKTVLGSVVAIIVAAAATHYGFGIG